MHKHYGWYLISLYNFNKDGHDGNNRYRDYIVEIKDAITHEPGFEKRFNNQKLYASTRMHSFRNGVYKQFLVKGGQNYTTRIVNNHSFNTILAGIFIDKFSDDDVVKERTNCLKLMKDICREEDLYSKQTNTSPSQLHELHVTRLTCLSNLIHEVKSANPPGYYINRNKYLHVLVDACKEVVSKYDSKSQNEIVIELYINALHELKDFDKRDSAVDDYLTYLVDKVVRTKDKLNAVKNVECAISRLCQSQWVVDQVQAILYSRLANTAQKYLPFDTAAEQIKRYALKCESLYTRAMLFNTLINNNQHGLTGFTKAEAYECIKTFDCLDRYKEALSICEGIIEHPGFNGSLESLLVYARDLSATIGDKNKTYLYATRLDSEYNVKQVKEK